MSSGVGRAWCREPCAQHTRPRARMWRSMCVSAGIPMQRWVGVQIAGVSLLPRRVLMIQS